MRFYRDSSFSREIYSQARWEISLVMWAGLLHTTACLLMRRVVPCARGRAAWLQKSQKKIQAPKTWLKSNYWRLHVISRCQERLTFFHKGIDSSIPNRREWVAHQISGKDGRRGGAGHWVCLQKGSQKFLPPSAGTSDRLVILGTASQRKLSTK